ncbi:MAG: insulinase family protein [Planctomycetes bacterium]|nr:insulinase family protein [Planctomycetota bacterium]
MAEAVFQSQVVAPGVTAHVLPTDRFRTTVVRCQLVAALRRSTVAALGLLPYVLRRGTRRLPGMRAMSHRLDSLYGAGLHVDVSKVGEMQILGFQIEVVSGRILGGPSVLRQGLGLLWDVLLRPARGRRTALREDWVEQEREQMRRFVAGLANDKAAYALRRCMASMCALEPFGLYEYGSPRALARLGPEGLAEAHLRAVRGLPIHVHAVGDVEPAVFFRQVGEAFRVGRRPVLAPRLAHSRGAPRSPRQVLEERDVAQAQLCMGYRTGRPRGEADHVALGFANGVLGVFPHSKLFQNVRERAALAYSASSSVDRVKGVAFVHCGIAHGTHRAAQRIAQRQVEDLARGRVTRHEMESTREGLLQALHAVEDDPAQLIELDFQRLLTGHDGPLARTLDGIQRVTREDLRRVVGRWRLDTVYLLTRPAGAGEASA